MKYVCSFFINDNTKISIPSSLKHMNTTNYLANTVDLSFRIIHSLFSDQIDKFKKKSFIGDGV